MNVSTTSGAYGGGQAQRLLASLLQQTSKTGQNSPSGDASSASGAASANGPPPGPHPGPPPGGGARSFASNTLASLLSVQEESGSSNIADKLIEEGDTDGDGSLSLEEIQKAMGVDSSDELSAAVSKLDADGDGKLSSTELSAGLEATRAEHAGRGGRSHAAPSSDDVAARLISDTDGDGDGSLSLDEVNSILKTDSSSSSSPTEAFGSLDSDGDGKLSASELSTALSAFKAAQGRSSASQSTVSA